jgi:Ca2+-binding EF-hand superfamily protein
MAQTGWLWLFPLNSGQTAREYSMILSAAMALLLQTTAAAPAAKPAPQLPSRAIVQARAKEEFDRLDTNKDGFVDKAEAGKALDAALAAREEAQFNRLDADKNGSISKQEFLAAMGKPNDAQHAAYVTINDVDKNGKVSLAEVTAKQLNAFDRIDTDKNGVLSQAEIDAFRKSRTARR